MSDLQKEATANFTGGRVFNAIKNVFENMPERFTTNEICNAAKLKGCGSMYSAIAVLERSFHCNRNANGIWRKPAAAVKA